MTRIAILLALSVLASGVGTSAAPSLTVASADSAALATPTASPRPSDLDVLVERITTDIKAAIDALPPGDVFCATPPTPAPSAKPTPYPSPLLPACLSRSPSFTADLRAAVEAGLLALDLASVPACLAPWTDMVGLALRLLGLSLDAVTEGPTGRPMFFATGPVGYVMLTTSAPALRGVLDCDVPEGAA